MSDTNWQSYYGDKPDTSGFVNPPNPQDFDDIMKFSDCTNVVVTDKEIAAGSENCIDAVRGSYYFFDSCKTQDGARVSTFTVKGSIDGFILYNCLIGKGKQTDIELGQFDNYWYPGRKPTKRVKIVLCKSTTGKPIRVTCWDAERPEVVNSDVKVIKIPWIIWFPYFCIRYIQIRLFKS